MNLEARVDALVNDPSRVGWRGNTTQWAKRAKSLLQDKRGLSVVQLQRVAVCILDVWLLRPDLAVHCSLHIPNTWDALYADTCHVVVTPKAPTMSVMNWLGVLAYYVRHHPRMGVKRANQVVSPGMDALLVALSDDTWGDGEMVVCPTLGILGE